MQSWLFELLKRKNSPNLNENLKKLCKIITVNAFDIGTVIEAAKFLWSQGEDFGNIRKLDFSSLKLLSKSQGVDLVLERIFASSDEANNFDRLMAERLVKSQSESSQQSDTQAIEQELKPDKDMICYIYGYIEYFAETTLRDLKSSKRIFKMVPFSDTISKLLAENPCIEEVRKKVKERVGKDYCATYKSEIITDTPLKVQDADSDTDIDYYESEYSESDNGKSDNDV